MADENARMGRAPRAQMAATEDRRDRRRSADAGSDLPGLKLVVPDWVREKFPESQFVHRWFSQRPGRHEWAHANDWDRVEGTDAVPATDKDGQPAPHLLYVKHRDWFEADRAPREEARKALEEQMARGSVTAAGDQAGETLSTKHQYAEASSGNRLR